MYADREGLLAYPRSRLRRGLILSMPLLQKRYTQHLAGYPSLTDRKQCRCKDRIRKSPRTTVLLDIGRSHILDKANREHYWQGSPYLSLRQEIKWTKPSPNKRSQRWNESKQASLDALTSQFDNVLPQTPMTLRNNCVASTPFTVHIKVKDGFLRLGPTPSCSPYGVLLRTTFCAYVSKKPFCNGSCKCKLSFSLRLKPYRFHKLAGMAVNPTAFKCWAG